MNVQAPLAPPVGAPRRIGWRRWAQARLHVPSIAPRASGQHIRAEQSGGWDPEPVKESSAPDLVGVLSHVLGLVRWFTILALFLLSLAQPLVGRLDQPTWLLILAFAGYSAVISLLRRRVSWLLPTARTAMLDLVVVTALYCIAATPGGPLFVLILLVTVSASCTTTLRRSLACTISALLVLLLVSPTLPLWTENPTSLRDLFARLIVVALANVGAALLIHQLQREHDTAREASAVAQHQAELIQAREAFVASVSHELRTPLTAMRAGLGMLELSLRDRMREDEVHLLGTARRNSERLRLLVDDLLTYNQLEANALRLEHDALDLRDVVHRALGAVAPLLAEKGQSLTVSLADRLLVQGDARHLEHTLINLVANAYEHTPAGTNVSIMGQVTEHEVQVMVSDDGPGIPADARERIFDRYQQLHPTEGGGSGLGLAIAKRIIELHGGRLWVESGFGPSGEDSVRTGNTFCLALPRLTSSARGGMPGREP